MDLFKFDLAQARRSIVEPDGAIWPVDSHSDADELNSLFEVAVEAGIIASDAPSARIHIYPLSISEPEPILAVNRSSGPSLLGYSLKLRERDGETPLEFTLRLLEETTIEANALAGQAVAENQPCEPADALRRFISAAQALDQAWAPALQVEGYPPYLPSFDQFALEIASMRFKAPRGG